MALKINLSGVKTMDFTIVPAGTYNVVVDNVEERTSQASQNKMLSWTFRIVGGPYDTKPLFTNTVLTEAARWKLKNFLMAFGFSEEDLDGDVEFEVADFRGQQAVARVIQREYDGSMRNEIKSLSSPEDAVAGE